MCSELKGYGCVSAWAGLVPPHGETKSGRRPNLLHGTRTYESHTCRARCAMHRCGTPHHITPQVNTCAHIYTKLQCIPVSYTTTSLRVTLHFRSHVRTGNDVKKHNPDPREPTQIKYYSSNVVTVSVVNHILYTFKCTGRNTQVEDEPETRHHTVAPSGFLVVRVCVVYEVFFEEFQAKLCDNAVCKGRCVAWR